MSVTILRLPSTILRFLRPFDLVPFVVPDTAPLRSSHRTQRQPTHTHTHTNSTPKRSQRRVHRVRARRGTQTFRNTRTITRSINERRALGVSVKDVDPRRRARAEAFPSLVRFRRMIVQRLRFALPQSVLLRLRLRPRLLLAFNSFDPSPSHRHEPEPDPEPARAGRRRYAGRRHWASRGVGGYDDMTKRGDEGCI